MRTRSSFTIIELIIVLVIVGILIFSLNFKFFNNNLEVAADQIINNIRFTQSLALKEDKYQPFPLDNSVIEQNRSKYWFKQWWHLKITDAGDDIIYYVFSDSPQNSSSTTFDKKIVREYQYKIELATNPLNNKYLCGANKEDTGNNNYPIKAQTDKKLNLTKTYNIKAIEFNRYSSSSMHNGKGPRIDILFDSFGNVFLSEGKNGDEGDINPLDKDVRPLLTSNASIKLCLDKPCNYAEDRCIQINITPTGYVYKSTCN